MEYVITKHSSQSRKRNDWETSRYRKSDSRELGKCAPSIGTKSIYDDKGRSTGSVRYKDSKVTIAPDGTSTVSALGTVIYRTSTEYDTKGRVKSSTDAYGNTTTYEYDSLDRQQIVKQANGLITETIYNSKGQVWQTIIKSGSDVRTTEYKYDIYGNIAETIQPDGAKISAEYNNKGQKISETNQLGQTRTFEYDDNGQLIKVTLPEVNGQMPVYEYTYDAQGNQLTIKDPNCHITSFTYDLNGNQLTRILPDGSEESFEYNEKCQLEKETSFEGVVTVYQYDKYGRLESKTFTQNRASEVWEYVYDEYGRIKNILRDNVIVSTTIYDEQGRIKSVETLEGKIAYTYNEFGQQASVKTDNDEPTLYSYDNYGRLKTVKYDNQTTTYEYDTFGNLSKTTTDTGAERLVTTYQYDNMNRLVKLTNFKDVNKDGVFDSGEGISELEYTLNDIGQKTKALEKFWADYNNDGSIDLLINGIDWEYDELGRLTSEVFDHYANENDQTQKWQYDLVGNRLTQTVDKGNDNVVDQTFAYFYDENDRLVEELFDGQNDGYFEKKTEYSYDHTQQTSKYVSENGVLVSETTFEYDLQGRMAVVTIITENRKEVTKYEYGTDGIRTSAEHEVWENGELKSKTRTEYINDSQVIRQTETVDGIVTKTISYVIGHQRISQIVTDKDSNQLEYYFTFDGHSSTRALVDFTGAVAQLYAFDAYGNAIGFNPATALTEFLYSGEQFDAKIGQQYLRARYYDPATGRFNRLDPFFGNKSDPQSLHKYLYTHADPVNGVDPSGLAVYFMVRPIASWDWAMQLEFATGISVHGYLYVTDPNNDNIKIGTYSWHPNKWLANWELAFFADKSVPGRIWKNDWRDDPINLQQFTKILITKDPNQQNALIQHINNWRNNENVGWEEGNFGVQNVNPDWGNRGLISVPPGINAESYCFLSNNCFWWAQQMLVGSGTMSDKEFSDKGLNRYNLGAGTTDIPYVQLYQMARNEVVYQIASFATKQITAYAGIQSARLNHSVGMATMIATLGFC